MKTHLRLVLAIIAITGLLSCSSDEPTPRGSVRFDFTYFVAGEPVEWKTMKYVNAAGNEYEVTEAQWFISDISLFDSKGSEHRLFSTHKACYIDSNIPSSSSWTETSIPAESYTSIRFTFGLKGANNIPGQFPDPPESNMMWPYALGGDFGGYHYMKLNGFWRNTLGQRTPFNFHLGVGPVYDEQDNVIEFVQNWFEATLPVSVQIKANRESVLEFRMNIEEWFKNPVVYDHNTFGGMIMKNQEAMAIIRENGRNVFTIHNHSSL